jgi:hypothetical protein
MKSTLVACNKKFYNRKLRLQGKVQFVVYLTIKIYDPG